MARIRLDKQIQKASRNRQFPLSDANGELQFTDIGAAIKTGETQTTLNSVEVTGGTLVIRYTPENGVQQVVSTPLDYNQTDINVTDAILENPSAGVYRLIITETDGSTHPVDLSALLAVVTQNTQYVTIEGNGTPQNPLRILLSETFWQEQVRKLDDLDDVVIDEELLNTEADKRGVCGFAFDKEQRVWRPYALPTLYEFYETTDVFRDLVNGNAVQLGDPIVNIVPQSIKVFRNGLRQQLGVNYELGEGHAIEFLEPFSDVYAETVTVDYRLIPDVVMAA